MAGGRVQQVVRDLRRVEDARFDDLVQRRRVTHGRDPEEQDLALAPEALERGGNLAEDDVGRKGLAAVVGADRVVELQQVDAFPVEPSQAGLDRGRDRPRDIASMLGSDRELGAEKDVWPQLREDLAEVRLGLAVPVGRGRVEEGDAELESPGNGVLLLAGRAANHQATDCTAAHAEHRNLGARVAKCPLFHVALRTSSLSMRDGGKAFGAASRTRALILRG